MVVYDCDTPDDFGVLGERAERRDLLGEKLLQAFGPDTLAEAQNRGFHPR